MIKKNEKIKIGKITYVKEDTMNKIIAMNTYNQNKVSTSKIVLALVMATYFTLFVLGIVAAVILLFRSPEYAAQIVAGLFLYVGTTTPVALSFYSMKAKAENVAKIANVQASMQASLQNENNDSSEEEIQV